VLPSSYRNITFDRAGVCNYCTTYDELRERLTDYERLRALLLERFDLHRGQHDYDCLVGLSGGKDSSYLAYTLNQEHDLNVLAFTFDNGFLNDYARSNIELVVGKLGLDHFYHKIDWSIHGEFYRLAIEKLGLPCLGCGYLSVILMNKLAFEREISLIIHGRSRAQMFKELAAGSLDAFVPYIKSNLSPPSVEANKAAASEALTKARYFLDKVVDDEQLRQGIVTSFFPDMDEFTAAAEVPEYLGFFLFEEYDEQKYMDVLERELGWHRPESQDFVTHGDCLIHEAAVHVYNEVLTYPLLAQELSVMVREGDITRDEAVARLGREHALHEYPAESMKTLCERTEIREQDLPGIIRRNRRKHRLLRLWLKMKYLVRRPSLDL